MPRGETTTIRPPQNEGKALREWRRVIGRNATSADLEQAKVERVGTIFKIECGDTYRVRDIVLDDLYRLIEVGQLEEIAI